MSSVRIVHSAAPEDQPDCDLHIWTPSCAKDLRQWIAERGFPSWVGINASVIWKDYDRWISLFTHLHSKWFTNIRFVLYTDIECTDSDGPCGCTYNTPCDYHRHEEVLVADCGCSRHFKTICAYHE